MRMVLSPPPAFFLHRHSLLTMQQDPELLLEASLRYVILY